MMLFNQPLLKLKQLWRQVDLVDIRIDQALRSLRQLCQLILHRCLQFHYIGLNRAGISADYFQLQWLGATESRCGINEITMVVKARTITIMRDFLIV